MIKFKLFLLIMYKSQNVIKRKHDPSFVNMEKYGLLKLIYKLFKIIECKETEWIKMKKKIELWWRKTDVLNASSISQIVII